MKQNPSSLSVRKSEFVKAINQLHRDIDKALKNAGNKKEFDAFSKESLKFYKLNLGKSTDLSNVPWWVATVQLGDKFYFSEALNYLMIVYGWDYEDMDRILMEEFDHYDEAISKGMEAVFLLRFYYDRNKLTFEPSTFVLDRQAVGPNYLKKLDSVVKAPLKRKGAGSEWDDKIAEYVRN